MKNKLLNLIQINFKKVTAFFLGLSLTFIMGCGQDNNIAGGPSIGGTGPFTTTTNEQIVAMKFEMPGSVSTDASDKAKVGAAAPTAAPAEDKSNSNAIEESATSNTKVDAQSVADTESQNTITTKKSEAESTKNETNTNTASAYKVKRISKSVDQQQCNGFERSINLLNNNIPMTGFTTDKIDEITIETTVKNPTDKNISEIKFNCNNYELIDFAGNVYNTKVKNCKTPREVLMFLPKQTHKYSLKLSQLLPGKYRINYLNTANKSNVNAEERAACETYIAIEITK